MADPTTGNINAVQAATELNTLTAANNNYTEAAGKAKEATKENILSLGDFSNAIGGVYDKVANLTKNLIAMAGNTSKLDEFARGHTQTLANMSMALVTVGKNYEQFDALVAKSAGFRTYGQEIQDLAASTKDIGQLISSTRKLLSSEDLAQIDAAAKKGSSYEQLSKMVVNFASKSVEAADRQKVFSEVLLSRAGETGYLDMLEKTSLGFTKLNEVTATYNNKLITTESVTGVTRAQAQEYYNTLSTLPNIMEQNVKVNASSTQSMMDTMILLQRGAKIPLDTLKASYQTARDAGNIMAEDGKDGATKMAQYLASLSETSNRLGVEFDKVTKYSSAMAASFKFFGDEGVGSLKVLDQLLPALRGTGLSAQNSADLIASFTGKIATLSEAQKAFLSQQTGGPGGLMGAFQIDQALREGKIDEVFNKVRETMTKQMGPLVSLKEAAGSPEAAAQYEKQVLMLRQGPMGQLVGSQAEAERLIDAFKAAQEGDKKPMLDAAQSLEKINQRGISDKERNETFMGDTLKEVSQIRGFAQEIALNTAQSIFNVRDPGMRETLYGTSVARGETVERMGRRQELEAQSNILQEIIRSKGFEGPRPERVPRAILGIGTSGMGQAEAMKEVVVSLFQSQMQSAREISTEMLKKEQMEVTAKQMALVKKGGVSESEVRDLVEQNVKLEMEKKVRGMSEEEFKAYSGDQMQKDMAGVRLETAKRLKEQFEGVTATPGARRGETQPTALGRPRMAGESETMQAIHNHRYEVVCFKCTQKMFDGQRTT